MVADGIRCTGSGATLLDVASMLTRSALEDMVDACADNSDDLLRKQLLRLRRLGPDGIARYKRYAFSLDDALAAARPKALAANLDVFSDPVNLQKIARYVNSGKFPWESD